MPFIGFYVSMVLRGTGPCWAYRYTRLACRLLHLPSGLPLTFQNVRWDGLPPCSRIWNSYYHCHLTCLRTGMTFAFLRAPVRTTRTLPLFTVPLTAHLPFLPALLILPLPIIAGYVVLPGWPFANVVPMTYVEHRCAAFAYPACCDPSVRYRHRSSPLVIFDPRTADTRILRVLPTVRLIFYV